MNTLLYPFVTFPCGDLEFVEFSQCLQSYLYSLMQELPLHSYKNTSVPCQMSHIHA